MDLSVKIGNVTLDSPIISSSCVDGMDGERICEVAEFHLGAATTKTIVANMQPDVLPNMKMVRGGSMINCVFGANLTAEQWFEKEMPIALKAGVPIIANLAGTHPAESVDLAKKAQDAGATFIELPTACPHMANVLEVMYPGVKMVLPEVHDPSDYARTVEAVKKAVSIPVISKFSAIYHYNVKDWAKACVEAGADAISAADSIGPAIGIDIETGEPLLGGPRGYGGLTGAAIKPIVLKMIYEIAEVTDLPIIGIGGVSSGLDAIEYFMAGASAVGVAAKSNLMGPDTYGKIRDEIAAYLDSHGYSSIADIRGLTHKRVAERAAQGRTIIHTPVAPEVDPALCNGCGSCLRSCVYDSITMEDKKPVFHPETCYGCGLCVSVCPKKALSQHYYD